MILCSPTPRSSVLQDVINDIMCRITMLCVCLFRGVFFFLWETNEEWKTRRMNVFFSSTTP